MNLKNFAINNIAIYEPIILGDIVKMRLTSTAGGNTVEFYPYILTIYPSYFTARIETVISLQDQDLNNGKVFLVDEGGYYDYEIFNNDVSFETGQVFIQNQEQISVVTVPFWGANGSSGTSGISGTSGSNGLDGSSGSSGLSGTSGVDGLNGTSGIDGLAGTSGVNGETGAAGTSGVDGNTGLAGTSGIDGSSGSSGADGAGSSGSSGVSGGDPGLVTNGANGLKSASALTTNPALSTGTNSIVLGDNAKDDSKPDSIVLGRNARARSTGSLDPGGIAIGTNSDVFGTGAVSIGYNSAANYPSVAIGSNAKTLYEGVAIGPNVNASFSYRAILIGQNLTLGSDNNYNVLVGSAIAPSLGDAKRNIYIGGLISSPTTNKNDNTIIGHAATSSNASNVVVVGASSFAGGDGAVALGKSSSAPLAGDIAIGSDALITSSGGGSVSIGAGSRTNQERSVAVGRNAKAHYLCVAMGDGADAGYTNSKGGNIAIGRNSNANGSDANIAIGNASTATGANAVALGTSSNATASGSVALGTGVSSNKVDTVSVKALETQTPSTPDTGGIIIKDAGSTERRINIAADGSLQIDSTPVGGGGGLTPPMTKSMLPALKLTNYISWKTWVQTTGYALSARTLTDTLGTAAIFSLGEGEEIRQVAFNVSTAAPGVTISCGIYRVGYEAATNTTVFTDLLVDLGSISAETTGAKTITLGSPFVMGHEDVGSIAIVLGPNAAGASVNTWSNGVWDGNGGQSISFPFYRTMGILINDDFSSGLPATLANTGYGAETGNPLQIFIR